MRPAKDRFVHLENRIHHLLLRYSAVALRVSLGAVFLGFGVLKYVPGVSPAEELTKRTTHLLTFGLIPDGVSIVAIATLECFIGICLLSGRWMRLAIWLLAVEAVGILSPLVLLPGRLFAGPHGAPTLEGQYVLKDIILLAAATVVAALSFRGGRMVRTDLPPASIVSDAAGLDADQKLRVVLDGLRQPALIPGLCEHNDISEAEFYDWRDRCLAGAAEALAREDVPVAV